MGLEDGGTESWMFHYRTYFPMTMRAIACEVAVLWRDLQSEAERAGATEAVIMPESFTARVLSDDSHSVVIDNESIAFVFKKDVGGEWRSEGPTCGEKR